MSPRYETKTVTQDYQITTADDTIEMDNTQNSITAFLPPDTQKGTAFLLKHVKNDQGQLGNLNDFPIYIDAANAGGLDGNDRVQFTIPEYGLEVRSRGAGKGYMRGLDYYGMQ